MVLWILALADEILLRATKTPAVAAAITEVCPALGERDHADTSLLGFVGVLADLAALGRRFDTYL